MADHKVIFSMEGVSKALGFGLDIRTFIMKGKTMKYTRVIFVITILSLMFLPALAAYAQTTTTSKAALVNQYNIAKEQEAYHIRSAMEAKARQDRILMEIKKIKEAEKVPAETPKPEDKGE